MVTAVAPTDAAFYRRWVVANGWAEAAGLGTTLALGWRIAPLVEGATGVATVLAAALAAVLTGTLLEGVVVGGAQGGVLYRRLPSLPVRSWIIASAVGAGIAWVLGMIPSTIMGCARRTLRPPPPPNPAPWCNTP